MEANPALIFEAAEKNLSESDEEVWGMPKYEQNGQNELANLTDEQYLAMVR